MSLKDGSYKYIGVYADGSTDECEFEVEENEDKTIDEEMKIYIEDLLDEEGRKDLVKVFLYYLECVDDDTCRFGIRCG